MRREELEFFGGLLGFLVGLRWLMVVELRRLWQAHFKRHNQDLRALQQRQAFAQIAASQAEQHLAAIGRANAENELMEEVRRGL